MRAAVATPCCGWDTNGNHSLILIGRLVILSIACVHTCFDHCTHSQIPSVHGGSGWKVDKSGPCGNHVAILFFLFDAVLKTLAGSEAFIASFASCTRDLRASIVLPLDSCGTFIVRSKTYIKGTPPNCADSYVMSLAIKSSETFPSNVVKVHCPESHDCVPFFFSDDKHSCNSCSVFICAGSRGWRCFDCNFDLCHSCHNVESNDVDPASIISIHSVSGICCETWKSVSLYACAFEHHVMQLGLRNQAAVPALFAHFSQSGKDAEGWAGHHGAAFARTTVSYFCKVMFSSLNICESNLCLLEASTNTTQDRCGLLSYFAAREIEIPFCCNFCTGHFTAHSTYHTRLSLHMLLVTRQPWQVKQIVPLFMEFVYHKLHGTTSC